MGPRLARYFVGEGDGDCFGDGDGDGDGDGVGLATLLERALLEVLRFGVEMAAGPTLAK